MASAWTAWVGGLKGICGMAVAQLIVQNGVTGGLKDVGRGTAGYVNRLLFCNPDRRYQLNLTGEVDRGSDLD